jgi:hypothetical protein
MKKYFFIFLLLIVKSLLAQHHIEKPLSSLIEESDIIIRAKVINQTSRWITNEKGKHIYTFVEFNIIDVVKGTINNKSINLEIIGGTVNDTTEYVTTSFLVRNDQEMILLLDNSKSVNEFKIIDKFIIQDSKIFFNEKYLRVESFILFLKDVIDKQIALPDDITEIQKRIDSFELNTKKIKRLEIKSNQLQKISSSQSNANLAPYKPAGWSAEIVTSIVTGTNTDAASIKETDKIYIDWAVANLGLEDVNSSFLINLYVDNVLFAQWNAASLPSGYYVYVTDYQIDPLPNGNHSIKIVADPTNLISELNEADNEYTKNISVEAVAGLPTITNISPSTTSAGTNSVITITGDNFGAVRGTSKVEFLYRYGQPRIESTNYVSWSNTSIQCVVPIDIINGYPASASSGPVTVTTGTGTSVGYNFNVTFSYGNVKWNTNPARIPIRINENTTDLIGEGDEVIAAASSWSSAGAQFGFYYNGSTKLTNATSDGINEIVWGLTSGSLATTYYWYVGSTIVEVDMVFNDSFNWSKDGSQYDVQSVALHEFGHWLNLRDIYGGADSYKIMYGFSSSGVLKRNLTSIEVDGIKWIYGNGSVNLAAPLLSTPQNSASNISLSPQLFWNKVVGTNVNYRLQVSQDQNFSSPIYDVNNLVNNQYQLSNLINNSTYYWRVTASNTVNGTSDWSQVWSFTTIPQTFTITCLSSPAQGGTTSGCGTFSQGTQVTLNAVPSNGYQFLNWTEGQNVVSTSLNYSFTISSNRTLTANFELIPTLTLTQPNGGEIWQEGSLQEIKWTSINVQNIKIEYTTNNGLAWNIIINSILASTGKYDWTMPNSPTTQAIVRISDASNPMINDLSNNTFTISPIPSLTLTQPNGGEIWQRSSQQEIKWTSVGIQNIKIEFSTNNGSSWQIIVQSTPANLGKYDWVLPNIPTQQARVRISNFDNALLNDISNGVFTIGPIPTINLTSPNGGESWRTGISNSITWTYENITNIKIEFTTDNGNRWNSIVNSTQASVGIYNWLIPNINSAQAKIRISDTDNFANDTSDNLFHIVGVTRGDVNENGEVNGVDAALVLRNTVGLTNLSTRQQYAADTNQDGVVQAYDAFMILYFLLNGLWP